MLLQCFKYFLVLTFLIEKRALLNLFYYSCILISCWPRPGLRDDKMLCVCGGKFAENVYGCESMSVNILYSF